MKITQSSDTITPFGGYNFCYELFNEAGFPALIDQHLGQRVKTYGFNYSDIFTNHMAVFLNGGDCTEDVNEHLRDYLKQVKGQKVCSADTILRGIKELSTPSTSHISQSGVTHEFNLNPILNKLLIKGLKKTKQLDTSTGYTLDYDNQVIATNKYDAAKTYKKCNGYQSGVSSIGNYIVHIEGSNGNSPAKYQQKETLERSFASLENEGIKLAGFRADSASYQKEVIDLVTEKQMLFYIRAVRCSSMEQKMGALSAESWKKIRLGTQEIEVSEIVDYKPFNEEKEYRLVVSRIKRKDKQTGLFTGTYYTYRAILTNNTTWDCEQLVSFYNQRGESEKTFDVMNNDFGWSKLPFSFLHQNTAFMIITAIYANFYSYMIGVFSEKLSWVESNFRLKKFIFRFIAVPAKWIKTGGQYLLKLYTTKDYQPLMV